MPLNLNVLERLLLFRLHKGPAPVLDLFGGASFAAVNLALEMGVFEALTEGDLTPAELATRIDADADGVRVLLEFLDAQGYVAADGHRYRNTRMTAKWLTAESGTNLGPWLRFWDELVFPFWEANLEAAVRTGEPPETLYEWLGADASRWAVAQRGFRSAASVLADEVTDAVEVPERATRLLDVGGGHGLYALELCREHPSLSATVFDHPEALGVAREEIADAGLGDRVEVAGGDYLADDLGTDYDVALLFNVVHAHDAAENRRLFARVGEALGAGGRIAVLDQLAGSARTTLGEAGLGFVGLTYFATLGAELHAYGEVAEWLRAAGFEDVTRSSIRRGGPGNTLVQATKPGGG